MKKTFKYDGKAGALRIKSQRVSKEGDIIEIEVSTEKGKAIAFSHPNFKEVKKSTGGTK